MLILTLPLAVASASTRYAWLRTSDGRAVLDSGEVPATSLASDAEVVAVVPVQALSWTRVTLPKGVGPRSPKLTSVLRGLLEDRLLDEPDQLHLVLGAAPDANGAWPVAVCHKAWLQSHLMALQGAGIGVQRIVPELAPRATPTPELTAVGDADSAEWIHLNAGQLTRWPLTAASVAALRPAEGWPEGTPLRAEGALVQTAEALLQQPVNLHRAQDRALWAAQTTDWNLAQGDLAVHGQARWRQRLRAAWSRLWRAPEWRPLRWGLGLVAAANLIGLNVSAWQAQRELKAQQDANLQLVKATFPQLGLVVNAPLQMQREVNALRQSRGAPSPQDADRLMSALATALPADRSPSALDYRDGRLMVRGITLDDATLVNAQTRLRAQAYALQRDGDALTLRVAAPGGTP